MTRLGELVCTIAVLAVLLPTVSLAAFGQTLDKVRVGTFLIDRTEVSIGAYRAYASRLRGGTAAEKEGGGFEYAAGWTRRPGWVWHSPYGAAGVDNEPVVHVTWAEAQAYCGHVSGRLPTIAEWRLAAYKEMRKLPPAGFVAGQTYRYPVGEKPDGMNTNAKRHVAVGTTKQGVNGLYDMGANVWEWIADRRGDDVLTAGGSWWYGAAKTETSGAQWKPAKFYAIYIGFRCAYDK